MTDGATEMQIRTPRCRAPVHGPDGGEWPCRKPQGHDGPHEAIANGQVLTG